MTWSHERLADDHGSQFRLKQRVRKSAITVYGTDKGVAYVVRGNTLLQVRESESELRAELEGKPE